MNEGSDRAKDGAADVARVSDEIDSLRGHLGTLVGELDRRRQELFDLPLQARRHPVAAVVAAGAVALVVGGVIALAVRSRRQRQRPSVRARETRRALARLLDHPERVAAEPATGQKVLAAIGTTVGTLVAKRLIDRWLVTPPRARAAAR